MKRQCDIASEEQVTESNIIIFYWVTVVMISNSIVQFSIFFPPKFLFVFRICVLQAASSLSDVNILRHTTKCGLSSLPTVVLVKPRVRYPLLHFSSPYSVALPPTLATTTVTQIIFFCNTLQGKQNIPF